MGLDRALLKRDLLTRTSGEVAVIKQQAADVVYSGAGKVQALSSITEFNREDAQDILSACLDILAPSVPSDADPTARNYAAGRPALGSHVDRSETLLWGP